MGYCLLVRRDAIIGAHKPPSLAEFEAYLGPGSEANEAERAEANRVAEKVASVRDFTVSVGSVGQILFKKPGLFFGGFVIIKTGQDYFRIDMRLLSIGGERLLAASETLTDSFRMVVGDRLCHPRSGQPVIKDWPWLKSSQ